MEKEESTSQELPELVLQSKCFLWHWNTYPAERRRLYHIQNKAKNKIEGAKFKSLGVVQGIADLAYLCRGTTVYIEMKVGDNGQSKEQFEFEAQCVSLGIKYIICRTFEQFQKIIWENQKK